MVDKAISRKLIYTEQGKKWLDQFSATDKEVAIKIANSLMLVSHNEFRRNLAKVIEENAANYTGAVALFAARELDYDPVTYKSLSYFEQVREDETEMTVSSLSASSEQGSEAIIAQLITSMARSNPDKYLNHPTVKNMRAKRCKAIFCIDDIIGSGNRMNSFIDGFLADKSIRSWKSLEYFNFVVIAYSATEKGEDNVLSHKAMPSLDSHRDAASFNTLPLHPEMRKDIKKVCAKYGRVANKNRKSMWWGYKEGMAAIIFEHGCPNNTPAILWEPDFKNNNWTGLFPNRTVTSATHSVFPDEIAKGDTNQLLKDIGQPKLANSGALVRRGELGELVLLALALIAKGQRRRATICYATGLDVQGYERLISACIRWKFINLQRRITEKGLAELKAARFQKAINKTNLEEGSNYYYPQQLRGAACD